MSLYEDMNLRKNLMKCFCPLASGSRGNSIYLSTTNAKILIDAGISAKNISNKLASLNIDVHEIDAILITHEHTDHIRGLDILSKKFKIPIFANAETAKAIYSTMKTNPSFKIFTTGETFEFYDLIISPFSVQHDTCDPVGFAIKIGNTKIGICTDLGFISTSVTMNLQNCNYLYIESNHEPSMVFSSNRPYSCKNRILGRQGHLSNDNCAKLIYSIHSEEMKHIFLAHLSSECNNPELAIKKTMEQLALKNAKTPVSIAHQNEPSNIIYY